MLKEFKIDGKEYLMVDTINKKPILIDRGYLALYTVAGVDAGSPLSVDDDKAIITEDGEVVGYFGHEAIEV